jgi:hypothetical protein
VLLQRRTTPHQSTTALKYQHQHQSICRRRLHRTDTNWCCCGTQLVSGASAPRITPRAGRRLCSYSISLQFSANPWYSYTVPIPTGAAVAARSLSLSLLCQHTADVARRITAHAGGACTVPIPAGAAAVAPSLSLLCQHTASQPCAGRRLWFYSISLHFSAHPWYSYTSPIPNGAAVAGSSLSLSLLCQHTADVSTPRHSTCRRFLKSSTISTAS